MAAAAIDLHRRIGVERVGFRLEAGGAELLDQLLVGRVQRGSGPKVFSVPSTASPAIEASSFDTMPSPETSVAFRPWSAELADDQAGFGVQAAPVDDRDAGFLHLGDQRREVLVADVDAFIHDFGDAGGVHRLLGFVGKALAVRGLVVDDRDLGVLELLREIGAGNRALLVVAAAGAERVPQAALGEDCGLVAAGVISRMPFSA